MMFSRLVRPAGKLATLGLMFISLESVSGQQLGQGSEVDISPWRVLGALLLCVLLAAGAALVMRARMGVGGAKFWQRPVSGRLKVLETRRIAPQAWVSLIVLDDQEYLVGLSNNGTVLIDKPVTPAPQETP